MKPRAPKTTCVALEAWECQTRPGPADPRPGFRPAAPPRFDSERRKPDGAVSRSIQRAARSGWLQSSPSGGGGYPPLNIFRQGDGLVLIAEVPGIGKSDLDIQVKGRTVRLSGTKTVKYEENASPHRRERGRGRFDRSVTLPIEVDPDGVRAECHDGVLAVLLPRAERDRPRSIQVG